MAVLPGEEYLIQQIDGRVQLFHRHTEEVLVDFNPYDASSAAQAQSKIHELEQLDEEQKSFAHFWSGYFYSCAQNDYR